MYILNKKNYALLIMKRLYNFIIIYEHNHIIKRVLLSYVIFSGNRDCNYCFYRTPVIEEYSVRPQSQKESRNVMLVGDLSMGQPPICLGLIVCEV